MATAVEHGSEPQTPTKPLSLPVASFLGAIYIVFLLAVVIYGVPEIWSRTAGSQMIINEFIDFAVRQGTRVVVLIALWVIGAKLMGASAQKGLRGGILVVLAAAAIDFFIWRAMAINVNGSTGIILSSLVGAALVALTVRFLFSQRGEGWMIALEEQGWFHSATYKRILGQRVRRLTILGFLLLAGSGVWSLSASGSLPQNWTMTMPFEMEPVVVLPDARDVLPWVLMGIAAWVAYRAVNVPAFAEFLIATEAEMNKVSWTPRRRLGQDTIVVLTTTILMALFLLVVDMFWSFALSNKYIGVLPAPSTEKEKGSQVQQARW